MQVAEEIRAEIARQKISVRDLSEMTGIPKSSLARIVDGSRSPRITDAEAISRAVGIKLSDLIRRAETTSAQAA